MQLFLPSLRVGTGHSVNTVDAEEKERYFNNEDKIGETRAVKGLNGVREVLCVNIGNVEGMYAVLHEKWDKNSVGT